MNGSPSRSVLLVEDHQELAATVGAYLEGSGFIVDFACDGLTAMHLGVTNTYDVIVLDIMLPGVEGLEVCRRLRNDAHVHTPVIMLTARDQLDDKLKGFDAGADDYLIKPFDLPELEARIDAAIRRVRGVETVYSVGDLSLNADTMEVQINGESFRLSKTLFEILRILMRESPKVVSREMLERELWGEDLPESDALRSHIYSLRRAIEWPSRETFIETLLGQGYCVRQKRV